MEEKGTHKYTHKRQPKRDGPAFRGALTKKQQSRSHRSPRPSLNVWAASQRSSAAVEEAEGGQLAVAEVEMRLLMLMAAAAEEEVVEVGRPTGAEVAVEEQAAEVGPHSMSILTTRS